VVAKAAVRAAVVVAVVVAECACAFDVQHSELL
jgi:hypothetical protein